MRYNEIAEATFSLECTPFDRTGGWVALSTAAAERSR
jgi:hypothetical protein